MSRPQCCAGNAATEWHCPDVLICINCLLTRWQLKYLSRVCVCVSFFPRSFITCALFHACLSWSLWKSYLFTVLFLCCLCMLILHSLAEVLYCFFVVSCQTVLSLVNLSFCTAVMVVVVSSSAVDSHILYWWCSTWPWCFILVIWGRLVIDGLARFCGSVAGPGSAWSLCLFFLVCFSWSMVLQDRYILKQATCVLVLFTCHRLLGLMTLTVLSTLCCRFVHN